MLTALLTFEFSPHQRPILDRLSAMHNAADGSRMHSDRNRPMFCNGIVGLIIISAQTNVSRHLPEKVILCHFCISTVINSSRRQNDKQGHIAAAWCFDPLTDNFQLSKKRLNASWFIFIPMQLTLRQSPIHMYCILGLRYTALHFCRSTKRQLLELYLSSYPGRKRFWSKLSNKKPTNLWGR